MEQSKKKKDTKSKNKKEPSDVVGWTEISEERDLTSDFEGLVFN